MVYGWDGFSLDIGARRLSGAEGELHLEPQAFDVLVLLVQERARVLAKAEILDGVWGDQFVSESALTTRIKQVRRCLGDDGRTQKYIRNVHGHGYQFVGELTEVPPVESGPADQDTGAPARASSRPRRAIDIAVDIAVDDEYPFVGRAAVAEEIEAVLQTPNGTVFIGGAPGSGKSRLAVELLRAAAEAGTTVCAGRCEATVTSSLQAVRDAFAQIAASNPSALPRWSDGVEGQLVSLVPSLVDSIGCAPIPVDAYAGIDVFLTLFERVASDGPLIILIDDLQWSDEPTRSFLARLHRRLTGQHVATMATYRSAPSDLPDEVQRWIQVECRSNPSLVVPLQNLDDAASLELIAAVTGDPSEPHGRDLVAITGGHSLFLTESLRDLRLGQNPARSVSELIEKRLARQPDEVYRMIEAGAILGPEFPFPAAAAAAELDLDSALAAVDSAIDAELLHETASPSRFRFSHQLVPEAIVEGMTRSRKASLHRACVDALRDSQADEVEVAFHALGAVPLVSIEEATALSRAAAEIARQANQFDRAQRLLEAVLAAQPQARVRAEVSLEIGEILNLQGMPARAIAPLELVTGIARKNRWPDLFIAAALAHWNQSPFRKPSDTSTLRLLDEANDLLGEHPSVSKALVIAKTAVFNAFRQPLALRIAAINRATAMADEVGTTEAERLDLLEWEHITYSCPAGYAELDRLDAELERLRGASDRYFTDAAAPETSALVHGRGEDLRRITRTDDDRIKVQPIAEWRDLTTRSMFAMFEGDIAGARTLCDGAANIGEVFWGESSFALHGFGQFTLDLISNDWSDSRPLLEMLAAFGGTEVFNGALLAAVHATDGSEAVESLRDELDLSALPNMGEHILGGNGLIGFAEAAIRLDDAELASAVESALQPFEHLVLGVPWACSLAAADPLARLAERRGDHRAAERYCGIARSLYESLDAPCLLARLPS